MFGNYLPELKEEDFEMTDEWEYGTTWVYIYYKSCLKDTQCALVFDLELEKHIFFDNLGYRVFIYNGECLNIELGKWELVYEYDKECYCRIAFGQMQLGNFFYNSQYLLKPKRYPFSFNHCVILTSFLSTVISYS